MPFPPEQKQQTRQRIVTAARGLFNQHGFAEVTIDEIMAAAGLTRGGFYNHFHSKDELYSEALVDYAIAREQDSTRVPQANPEVARMIFRHYVSRDHRDNFQGQCPLMALPSDAARAGPAVRAAYLRVLKALTEVFEKNLTPQNGLNARQNSLALAATCVGAMVLARTVEDEAYVEDIIAATTAFADRLFDC